MGHTGLSKAARPLQAPAHVLVVLTQPALIEIVKLTLSHGRCETRTARSAAPAASAA